jgi:hypothetical protein
MAKPTFTSHVRRPLFDELPLGKDDPPFSAWGLYGKDDQLGTLNLLTSEIVVEAAKEVKNGMRIGLDLPLNYLTRVPFGRGEVKHSITADPNLPFHDDEISMNTQVSFSKELCPQKAKQGLGFDPVGWISTLWISES